ncbi:hypothetical protein D3C73_1128420 [compost metagenome]
MGQISQHPLFAILQSAVLLLSLLQRLCHLIKTVLNHREFVIRCNRETLFILSFAHSLYCLRNMFQRSGNAFDHQLAEYINTHAKQPQHQQHGGQCKFYGLSIDI